MRLFVRATIVLSAALAAATLAGCTQQSESGNAAAPVLTNGAAPQAGMRGDESADSASAKAARELVERYFAMIDKRDYAGAYRLWGNGGKDAGGTPQEFAESFAIYSKYEPQAGTASEIHAREGMQYVLVTAKAHVENKKTRKTADREGTVMLRRSTNPDDPVAEKRDWRIWGVDLRARS